MNLGGRVDRQIRAQIEGLLQERSEEGVVDGNQRLSTVRKLSDRTQVREIEGRVGRRFEEDQTSIRTQRSLNLFRLGRVDEIGGHSEVREHLLQNSGRAAVESPRTDDVIARLQEAQEMGGLSRQAGAVADGRGSLFELAEGRLKRCDRRVGLSRIAVLGLARQPGPTERGALHDRSHERLTVSGTLSGVYGQRFDALTC